MSERTSQAGLRSAVGLGLVTLTRAAAPTAPAARTAPVGPSVPPEPAGRRPDELRALADEAGRELADAPAEEIVRWAAGTFGKRFCVTSSMADGVLAHLVSRVAPGVDVVFLDTGLHFPETLKVRDEVARRLPVTVRSIRPRLTVGQQDGEYGPRLFARAPDQCCAMRKVEPLERALTDYDAWAAGLRRDESPTRANTPVVAFDAGRGRVKVNPIAAWTQVDVDAYVSRWNVPVNELFRQGYTSIGCWPCTRRTQAGEDPRAGRWAMFDKTECGLHV
ncbi:phosphoadenylyl-sulfate reductase [Micromonospora sonneratiae]|uniref:Adenosine 5'-phosphosulfate reductase n=1 Tax=Micromonospora sonneratiae TaxID=1184706 RepID=A0ABW3YHH2_9ACTN